MRETSGANDELFGNSSQGVKAARISILPDQGWKWKWSFALLNIGVLGMTMALLIAGYVQSQLERAIGGSSWSAYFEAQGHPWFQQAIGWRQAFGVLMPVGFVLLVWDPLTAGKRETRLIQSLEPA